MSVVPAHFPSYTRKLHPLLDLLNNTNETSQMIVALHNRALVLIKDFSDTDLTRVVWTFARMNILPSDAFFELFYQVRACLFLSISLLHTLSA